MDACAMAMTDWWWRIKNDKDQIFKLYLGLEVCLESHRCCWRWATGSPRICVWWRLCLPFPTFHTTVVTNGVLRSICYAPSGNMVDLPGKEILLDREWMGYLAYDEHMRWNLSYSTLPLGRRRRRRCCCPSSLPEPRGQHPSDSQTGAHRKCSV